MIAKRSVWALALLLALPSAAFALGLGDIHLLSSLNAPLNAEIELQVASVDEMNTVQASLASRETFARYGLDWPGYLASVQVRIVRTSDGRAVIKLKSIDPISDPFITVLVEVNWSRGHLVREYTMLLDPPIYAPGQSPAPAVSVAASGTGAKEGAIARNSESGATAPAPAAPQSAATAAPAPAAVAEPAAANTAPAATAAGSASAENPAPAASGGEPGTHLVSRGETLSRIAAAAAGARADSPQGRSWMLAIYQANPRAFDQNMNLLRSGAVLRMPDAATAAAVSPAQASAEIRRQYAAWRESAGGEAPAASEPGRLKLVPPSAGAAVGTTPAAPNADATALQGRVHDLESQLAESKRLLEMKNAELARLQSQLAAKQGAAATPPPATPPAQAERRPPRPRRRPPPPHPRRPPPLRPWRNSRPRLSHRRPPSKWRRLRCTTPRRAPQAARCSTRSRTTGGCCCCCLSPSVP